MQAAGCVSLGDRTNGRRRNPSTQNLRQSLGHGRCILCSHALGLSSGTGKCADWCCHDAWNRKAQICPSRASAANLLVGQHGLLVGDNINDAVMPLRLVLQLERVPCLPPLNWRPSFFTARSCTLCDRGYRYPRGPVREFYRRPRTRSVTFDGVTGVPSEH